LVNKVLHFIIIILPVGESVNLLFVILFHILPNIIVFCFDFREITRCLVSLCDLNHESINLTLTFKDVLIDLLNLSFDEGVLVFDELTTTAVIAKVSGLIG